MTTPNIGKQFTPKAGSFWAGDHGSPRVNYIEDPKDSSRCIGRVFRNAPRSFRAELYEKPLAFTTTKKDNPKVQAFRFQTSAKRAAEWLHRASLAGNNSTG